jgi:tetratricopeptide (TPR) repeat protein
MSSSRLEILLSMVAQNPRDSFARYGLAMEYRNSGKLDQAVAEFQTLLAANADYGAAYYHCGQALEQLGRLEEARSVYRQGIDATTRTGDQHTRKELQAALDIMG